LVKDKQPKDQPAQPLVIKTYPAEQEVYLVYSVSTLTGKNKLQNAIIDFTQQYNGLAFNDFKGIYEGIEKEVRRLNNVHKNCTPLELKRLVRGSFASIWITPKDSATSFEVSIHSEKITKILEGASLVKDKQPKDQPAPTGFEGLHKAHQEAIEELKILKQDYTGACEVIENLRQDIKEDEETIESLRRQIEGKRNALSIFDIEILTENGFNVYRFSQSRTDIDYYRDSKWEREFFGDSESKAKKYLKDNVEGQEKNGKKNIIIWA
jgi:uncharacterized protein YukE